MAPYSNKPAGILSECAICKGKRFHIRFKDVAQNRSIVECEDCGVWTLYPFPSSEEILKEICKDKYYDRWEYRKGNLVSLRSIKKALYGSVLKEIGPYCKVEKILDIGCAMGFSLEVALEKGIKPYGVEISAFAGNIATKKFNNAVKIGDINNIEFENGYFDAVTMVDVLEHMNNPLAVLEKCSLFLKEGGILALAIPDIKSLSAKIMGRNWPNITGEHLYLYSHNAIAKLLFRANFHVESIKSFPKPISISYAQSVLRYSGPKTFYFILKGLCACTPRALKTANFRFPTGEMLVIARKA